MKSGTDYFHQPKENNKADDRPTWPKKRKNQQQATTLPSASVLPL